MTATNDRIAAYYARGGGKGGHTPEPGYYTQSNGVFPLTEGWKRFNPDAEQVWVTGIDGKPHWLTRMGVTILAEFIRLADTGHTTYTEIAARLNVSVSTVSRTATKVAAWGIVAIVTTRGRYGGAFIIKRTAITDGFDRFRQAAKARIRKWYQAAQDRISRLESNLAPYGYMERKVSVTSTHTHSYVIGTKAAKLERWTPEELREAGII